MPDRTSASALTASAALQGLIDAGDDVPKLIEAVKNASFLEDIPSPERQALRASKRKLKRALVKQTNEKRKSLFQGKDLEGLKAKTDKFVKNPDKFQELCDLYQNLKWRIVKMPGGATRKADAYYTLHGLMKQALIGDVDEDCPMFAENGNIDFHGRFLWDSWNLAKGLKQEEAKQKFVSEFFNFSPSALYKDTRTEILPSQAQAAY